MNETWTLNPSGLVVCRGDLGEYQVEGKEISRWYPYSLRSLLFDGSWFEIGRYTVRNAAFRVLKARESNQEKYSVIVQCSLLGKEGREAAVYCTPGGAQAIIAERQRRLAKEV